jgi:ribonuclease P protein component
VRNRVKRRFRTLFRRNKLALLKSTDLIVIAKKNAHLAPWNELREDYLKALQALGWNH